MGCRQWSKRTNRSRSSCSPLSVLRVNTGLIRRAVIALLDEVMNKYAVDASRVYLTGHSMGGFGTWYLAYKHPEKFAAIAPMSAPMVITAWASRLKEMPIWVFHGEKDELVPVPTPKIWFMRSRLWGMTSG